MLPLRGGHCPFTNDELELTMGKLRILMLGWEDQPVLNGGVGKACFHLAESLTNEVELTLIVPQAEGQAYSQRTNVVGLNDLDLAAVTQAPVTKSYERFAKTYRVPANLFPYENEDEYYVKEALAKEAALQEGETLAEQPNETAPEVPRPQPEIAIATGPRGTLNFEVIQFARFAARLASHKEIDVVYAHDWMTFLAGIEIKNQRKVPLVLHVHSLTFDRQVAQPWGWVYELEAKAMQQADLILAVSERTAHMIATRYGVSKSKIKVVYNGSSENSLAPMVPAHAKQVIFLGRLVPQKGPLQFIRVAKCVHRKDPEVQFVVTGHGPLWEEAQQLTKKLDLEEVVSFKGFLPAEEAKEMLRESSVFCLPAVSEPFGLAAVEATQAGIPVVISRQTGAAEVLPSAYLSDAQDTEGLADHILELLNDNALRTRAVQANQAALKDLTWKAASEQVYQALLSVAKPAQD
ncbi:glycosyltransferase [Nibribacter ruber]|uniref:Glycosyltransferase n=1 Tax=Nibribacter ruber TaxID=2698458 RepID=A0A6P1NWG7_9BACT|nr:glycosyltransferase family 4 protein [Nibribacter ruber]QHL86674.1 glycosyltransferase [Nibribacter ruber]